MLMQLFIVCQQCGARLSPGKVRLIAEGTAPVVQYYCSCCSIDKGDIKRWEGQCRSTALTRESSFLGNILTAISAVVTGTRFGELQRWAKQLRLSFISISSFYKWFLHCKPSIEKVYFSHQQKVFDVIRREYAGKGLHLAVGTSSYSRRSNGLIENVTVADLETRLLLHTEVLHRLGKNKSSTKMQVEGLRKLLQWLSSENWRISAMTTDRNKSFPALLDDLKQEIGTIQHFWDGICLMRWFNKRLRKEAKCKDCSTLSTWCKRLKAHLTEAVNANKREDIRNVLNACLKRAHDMRDWPVDDEACGVTRCCHPPMKKPFSEAPVESHAFEKLRKIVLNKTPQDDLSKANLRGGYTILKTKNVLDKLYLRRKILHPLFTYKLYAMLSTMHFNTLVFAETNGEWKVEQNGGARRKIPRKSGKVFRAPVLHSWRDQIVEAVLEEQVVEHGVPLKDVKHDASQVQGSIFVESLFDGRETKDIKESFYELGN
ncbi:hypothetical protein ANCCAN_22303 [Ancylostoma caninum]|uniref:Uncharacterized protein n=1 Tax=Ancylostoma caninum TaxID=29170 RepID=A0A368FIE0_ANCCA|nr:hypothetical protein ANCCAN_22303 [Ancylostoma caninum]